MKKLVWILVILIIVILAIAIYFILIKGGSPIGIAGGGAGNPASMPTPPQIPN